MFVNQVVPLPASLGDAKKRLRDFIDSTHDLQAASSAAFAHGMALLSPDGEPALTPAIVVQRLSQYPRGETDVLPFRWCILGDSANVAAPLDANLELGPAIEGLSQLALIGSYRPPQHHDAIALDRALIDVAARATCRTFLTSIAHVIAPPSIDTD